MKPVVCCDIMGDRIAYQVTGPLGTFRADGPLKKFQEIRDLVRVRAGLDPVSTSR